MGKAFNFYKSCKDKGIWGNQSPDHQKIIALSAELNKLKGGLKISNKLRNMLKQVQQRRQSQFKRWGPKDTKRNNKNRKISPRKCKHQLKASTNIAQLAIDDDYQQTSQQNDDNNNSDDDSLYNELMEIIKTEI